MRWLLFNILIVLLLFSGCAYRHAKAPVKDRAQPSSTKVGVHVVAEGETLYSIAWSYNLNYKDLARSNGIGRNYTIYPGQKIDLRSLGVGANTSAESRSSTRRSGSKTNAEVARNSKGSRLKNKSKKSAKNTKKKFGANAIKWNWPAEGKILKGFSANNGLNKGIDIGGKLGEPVLAAAPGTVVYSGDGLRGYGKLIIIKHSDMYLSAYAHNRRILVREGDEVGTNEKIAEMGNTGTDSVKLHFEIRFDGRPVDPIAYLPPK